MTSRSRIDCEVVRCSLGVLGYTGRRKGWRELERFQSRRRKREADVAAEIISIPPTHNHG